MASWVWPGMAPVRGACDGGGELGGGELGGGELGGGELGGGELGGGELGGGELGGGELGGGLAAGQGVADAAALLCPAEAPDEGVPELP